MHVRSVNHGTCDIRNMALQRYHYNHSQSRRLYARSVIIVRCAHMTTDHSAQAPALTREQHVLRSATLDDKSTRATEVASNSVVSKLAR